MIRRSLVLATALLVLGGGASQAFAGAIGAPQEDGRHGICLLGSDGPNGPREGICVWIPTK